MISPEEAAESLIFVLKKRYGIVDPWDTDLGYFSKYVYMYTWNLQHIKGYEFHTKSVLDYRGRYRLEDYVIVQIFQDGQCIETLEFDDWDGVYEYRDERFDLSLEESMAIESIDMKKSSDS